MSSKEFNGKFYIRRIYIIFILVNGDGVGKLVIGEKLESEVDTFEYQCIND